jgi:hypothetical protein
MAKGLSIRDGQIIGRRRQRHQKHPTREILDPELIRILIRRTRAMSGVKKIRYYGVLSGNQRTRFLRSMGMEISENKSTFKCSGILMVRVRETDQGMVLRRIGRRDETGHGWILYDRSECGDPVLIPWDQISMRPLNVKGTSRTWRRGPPKPGG